MPYDHSAFLQPVEEHHRGLAGTTIPHGVSVSFYARSLRKIAAVVNVAGTVSTAGVIVRGGAAGTTAIGTLTLGTIVALSTVILDITDSAVAVGDVLNFLHNLDATVVATVTYEYRYDPSNTLLPA